MRWPPYGEPPHNVEDWLRYLGRTDDTLVEPKSIDDARPRQLQYDLTPPDMKALHEFVLKPEKRRGYR